MSIEDVDGVVLPQFRPSVAGRRVMALSRETAIVGIGQTEFSKHSGRSELQLAGEAVAPRSPTPASRRPTSTAR